MATLVAGVAVNALHLRTAPQRVDATESKRRSGLFRGSGKPGLLLCRHAMCESNQGARGAPS